MGKYIGLMEDDPDFELVGTKWPVMNKGDTPIAGQKATNFEGVSAAISSTNKNPIETVKWLDEGYGEEGYMLFNWGIEGESYEMVDGGPVYTELITSNPDGLAMGEALATYGRAAWNGPFIQDPEYQRQYYQYDAQKDAMEAWASAENEILLPYISNTPEESKELSTILADMNTYKDTMIDKFIFGQESLDKFDEYVETLKGMNLERVVEIQQDALDRYNAR